MSNVFEPHDGRHTNCPECFTIKLRSLNFQGTAAASRRALDKSRGRDMDAYKRLRNSGIQPKHVYGSAEVEVMAGSQFEVEHHMVMSPEVRKEFTSRLEDAKHVS